MKKVTTMAAKLVAAAPEGWTVTNGAGYHDGDYPWPPDKTNPHDHTAWVKFENGGVVIVLNVAPCADKWAKQYAFKGLSVEGHTIVDGRCFTRRGVDCSSCGLGDVKDNEHVYTDVPSLLAGEFARCETSRARSAKMVPVPGLPFNVLPEWFATAAKKLRSGAAVTLTPHGFGIGYQLTAAGRGNDRRSRASAALEKAIGFAPIHVSQFDHD